MSGFVPPNILLFASRNDTVTGVMREVYAKEMTDHYGQASLFEAGDRA